MSHLPHLIHLYLITPIIFREALKHLIMKCSLSSCYICSLTSSISNVLITYSLQFLNTTIGGQHTVVQQVRFQVLTLASTKMPVFWVVATCSLVEVY
jgi:hypothetical protein